jgi:glutamate N-acetyltransferase / amino-acid N-acetyltransferase
MKSNPSQRDIPKGFSFSATACGLKKSGLDLALIASNSLASTAAVFTQNLVQAAPVVLSRSNIRRSRGRTRGLVVNSGNANCATGDAGMAASRATAAVAARALSCLPEEIVVCSTGVIGVPLRVEKIVSALPALVSSSKNTAGSFRSLTRAIMTTDTRPKWAAERIRIRGKEVRLLGCAKGAGMIQPNMATMLAFIVTDAAVEPGLLSQALRRVVTHTFNVITVDGDTSTNDTLAVFANGASGTPKLRRDGADFRRFGAALETICAKLALAIVADGEGAKRVIEIEVRGASSESAAETIARTIANSPLVKTALAGGDPNWGRILAAAGRAGVRFDPSQVDIHIAGMALCRRGVEVPFDERMAHRRMLAKFVPIRVDLRRGSGAARIWTCDFTGEYVRINASYRT